MADASVQRREVVQRILREQVVSSQEELRRLTKAQGYEVTQATLSRDLARLGARWVPSPEGGGAYELPGVTASGGSEGLRAVHAMVTGIEEGDAMVVVRTAPGAASIVAAAIDASKDQGVLGTLAGDDTVFIVPRRGLSAVRVKKSLATLWKKGVQR